MHRRRTFPLALAAMFFAVPALADMGGSSSRAPASNASTQQIEESQQPSSRKDAERDYGDAYSAIAKAKKTDDTKNAAKQFQKALDRARSAVEKDSTYHEAWNLVGYASRRLGHYDDAVAAYARCLAIRPDYAPAREYLGEAYLDMNQPALALEQLGLLKKQGAPEASDLEAAISGYMAKHPEVPAAAAAVDSSAASAAAPAASDSSAAK